YSSPAAPPTGLSTLSLHDALPIYRVAVAAPVGLHARAAARCRGGLAGRRLLRRDRGHGRHVPTAGTGRGGAGDRGPEVRVVLGPDRKSTRLNSSHSQISYAVFCLK